MTRSSRSASPEHAYLDLGDVRLHYVHAGAGPLLMFLHGVPQCWYMWRHQLRDLATDHHVVAVDLRGFNESTVPARLYETGVLASVTDVEALARHLGHARLTVIGHDVGVAVGWSFTLHHPSMTNGLVTISGAHPALFDRALREDPEQQRALGHWLHLRRPDVADLFRRDRYARFRRILEELPFLSDDDVATYIRAWSRPGALEGLLWWCQREGWGPPEGTTPAKGNYVPEVSPLTTDVPVLAMYGDADPYIRPICYQGLDAYASDLTIHRIDGGTHWLCEERPDVVNAKLRAFITKTSPRFSSARAV